MKTPKGFHNPVQVSLCTTTPPWAMLNFSHLPQPADAWSLYSLHLECLTPLFHLANSSSCFTTASVSSKSISSLHCISANIPLAHSHVCLIPQKAVQHQNQWQWLIFIFTFLSPRRGDVTSYIGGPPNYTYCYAAPCVIPFLGSGLNLLLALTNKTWQHIMPLASLSLKRPWQLPFLHSLEAWAAM